MIKADRLPICRIMALGTVVAELSIVRIVLLVAREAIHGRAFIHAIQMAAFTSYVDVGAFQLKSGAIVVEMGGFPIFS